MQREDLIEVKKEFALTIEMKDGQPGYRYGGTRKANRRQRKR